MNTFKKANIIRYTLLCIFAVVFIFPFVYAIYTSLLDKGDIDKLVSIDKLTLSNYVYIFTKSDILKWYLNSIIVTASILVGNIVINTMAAYALAKIKFPGRNIIFFIIIAMMMVPYQVLLIPLFTMVVKLDWMNSYQGLIVPFLFQGFLVFLMRQFFFSIPDDLEEAAKIDGLSKAKT